MADARARIRAFHDKVHAKFESLSSSNPKASLEEYFSILNILYEELELQNSSALLVPSVSNAQFRNPEDGLDYLNIPDKNKRFKVIWCRRCVDFSEDGLMVNECKNLDHDINISGLSQVIGDLEGTWDFSVKRYPNSVVWIAVTHPPGILTRVDFIGNYPAALLPEDGEGDWVSIT